ncbi:TonB-dependent receptor [Arenicella sp. 4NH20-0111]|uniref:TonB-dependent receptor n=1 Tax=Arenicella sp. 4NH20-0111 TaxID=3127648 RepID=UPI00310A78F9
MEKNIFTKTKVSLVVASLISASSLPVVAQEYDVLEEVTVYGVRAAQANSVNEKRSSSSIVDAISAEDIGKLPDVTISDSLQRIPGVQIRRSAGEGTSLNVRGLPQVQTTLNGESFQAAGSITLVQPDFGDIPSQLLSGATVYKSPTADLVSGGITGVVNLKTRRPLDFDEGFTSAGSVEIKRGEETEESDLGVSFLTNWSNGTTGVTLSVAKDDATLANFYNGMAGPDSAGWTGFPSESEHFNGGVPTDVNGDGDTLDSFIGFQGHTAYNKTTERDRLGINLAFQTQISDSTEFIAEVFHTSLENYDRFAGIANSDKWQRWGWFTPQVSRDTGVVLSNGNTANTVQVYQGDGRRLKSYSEVQVTEKESTNINLELNYAGEGPFSGSARLLYGKATEDRINSYADIDLANGSQWGVEFQDYANGRLPTNPNGYSGNTQLTVDYRGESPVWSGFDPIVGNLDAYSIGALASENNYDREADMFVGRLDGSYEFDGDGFFTSLDVGIRQSNREVENFQYHLLAPFGDQQCLVRWRATDVVLGADSCSSGNGSGTFFTAGNPTPLSSFGDDVIQLTSFGGASGIPSIYTLDPRAMDNVLAFHERLYPGNVRGVIPGEAYKVELDELSYFVKGNFTTQVGDIDVSGNLGVRVVDTDLSVTQNVVGDAQPYGAAARDAGDFVTKRSFSDVLPSLNLAFEISEDLVVRAAYAETLSPLDLRQWGEGLAPTYAINSDTGIFEIISANANGNPELDPWRASNYDLSIEYYTSESSMVSIGLFKVDIESFVERGEVILDLPDQDGVVRRSTGVSTNVQGEGGTLEGVELQVKQAFDFLPGFWSNFGVDMNLTYSPSDSGNRDLNGDELPFIDNSETLYNLIGWYQDDKFQARLAFNYRSERVVFFDRVWGTQGLTMFQAPTSYVDASMSYDINDSVSVYLNASNITGEGEEYYLQWEDQKAYRNEYEARYTIGMRGRF